MTVITIRNVPDDVRDKLATRVLLDLTAGVSAESTARALTQMRTASIGLIGNHP